MPMIGQQDIFSNLLKGHGATIAPFYGMISVVHTQPTMHIQVSPDGRFNWDYTPMKRRPGMVMVLDQAGEHMVLTTEEAREHWRHFAAKGWKWI